MALGSVSDIAATFTALQSAGVQRSVQVAAASEANNQARKEGQAVLKLIESASLEKTLDILI